VAKKPRKLSAWNIFSREQLSQAGSLNPEQWKQKQKEVSATWAAMSLGEKEPFRIKALSEQAKREELSSTPLPSKGSGKTELELEVGEKGCKKVSCKRLSVNEEMFQQHPQWSCITQLGDGILVCLSLLVASFCPPSKQMDAFLGHFMFSCQMESLVIARVVDIEK